MTSKRPIVAVPLWYATTAPVPRSQRVAHVCWHDAGAVCGADLHGEAVAVVARRFRRCPSHPSRSPAHTSPFAGSGTVGMVAVMHGRRFVGCELNPEYAALAEKRIAHPDWDGREVDADERQATLWP